MPFTTPQRGFERTWALSFAEESAYGTPLAFADLNKKIAFDDSGASTRQAQIRSDRQRIGKGTPFTTLDRIVAWDEQLSRPVPFSTLTAGWALSFAMGKVVSSGSGPYTETLTFADAATGAQAPSTTVWISEGSEEYRVHGLCCNAVEIAWRPQEEVTLTSEWIGSGERTTGAHSAEPAATAHNIVIAGDVRVYEDAWNEGSPREISDRIREGRIRISQNLAGELGYHPGSGLYRGRLWYGEQTVQVDLTVFDDGTGDFSTAAANRAMRKLQVVFPFGADHVTVLIPELKWQPTERALEQGFEVFRVTTGEDGVFKTEAATPNEPVRVQIVTAVEQELLVAAS